MKRIVGLDIVRTVAIMLVVCVHSTYVFPEETKFVLLSWIPAIDGVSVFFVLSGYLIGGILLRTMDHTGFTFTDLKKFWIRRWFRTLPNYFLVLALLLAYDVLVYKTPGDFSFHYLFFTQNLVTHHPDFFPEAWSLSVEEWFYLIFPFVCYLGIRTSSNKRNVLLAAVLIFLIAPFVLRLLTYVIEYKLAYFGDNYRKIVVFRLDSLMYGVLGAYAHRYKTEWWTFWKYRGLVISGLLVALLTIYAHSKANLKFWPVYFQNLESIATLAALPYFSELKTIRSSRFAAVFTFVSTISYAMYVLNLSIVQWRVVPAFLSIIGLRNYPADDLNLLRFALYWIFTFGGSYLLYRYYERPVMNLRDKI